MALPTLARAWQFQVNQSIPAQASALATTRLLMRSIKNALLGTGSWTDSDGNTTTSTGNWTVSGSCDASTAGMDGTDRWVTDTNLVWATTTRSWVVLRQTGIATKFELCIDLNTTAPHSGTFIVSPSAGFGTANGGTNGSTSSRPTATDEIVIKNGLDWGAADNASNLNHRLHVMKTSTGRNTRIVIARNGWSCALWAFESPSAAISGWSSPSASCLLATNLTTPTSTLLTYSSVAGSAIMNGRGVSSMAMFLTGEGTRLGTALLGEIMTTANDISGQYLLANVGLYSDTASNRGRHGTLADIWWGLGSLPDATTYPNDGTRQFMQMGALILPWNKSTPIFL